MIYKCKNCSRERNIDNPKTTMVICPACIEKMEPMFDVDKKLKGGSK